jgi:hypothetical protein
MRFLTTVSPFFKLYFERMLIDVEPETALQVFEQILQKKPIAST